MTENTAFCYIFFSQYIIAREKSGLERQAVKAKVESLLDAARRELVQRNLPAMEQLLSEAEVLDSSHPQIEKIRADFVNLDKQEKHRQVLDGIHRRVNEFLRKDRYDQATQFLARAISKLPTEPALHRLQMEVDAATRKYDSKQAVDSAIAAARKTFVKEPQKALIDLQLVIEQLPGEERLIACEISLRRQADQQHKQQQLRDALRAAREALASRQPERAVSILEGYQLDHGNQTDIDDLLAISQQELDAQQLRLIIERTCMQARALREENPLDAIQLLESAIEDQKMVGSDDRTLAHLLEDIREQQATYTRKTDALDKRARLLTKRGELGEAIKLLGGFIAAGGQSAAIEDLFQTLEAEHERQQATARAIEFAAKLTDQAEFAAAFESLQTIVRAYGESEELAKATQQTKAARSAHAQLIVGRSIEKSRAALLKNDMYDALSALREANEMIEFAEPAKQAEWRRIGEAARKAQSEPSAADVVIADAPGDVVPASSQEQQPREVVEETVRTDTSVAATNPHTDKTVVMASGAAKEFLRQDSEANKKQRAPIPVQPSEDVTSGSTQIFLQNSDGQVEEMPPPTAPAEPPRRNATLRPQVVLTFSSSSDSVLTGKSVPITQLPFIIGRDRDANLCISSDHSLSRQHCVIDWADGAYVIKDLESSNGTWLNGRRLRDRSAVLHFGSIIRFSNSTSLTFVSVDLMELPDLTGCVVGERFMLEELIRASKKSALYRGNDQHLPRLVAVKVLSPDLAIYPGYSEQFDREAKTAAGMRHSNIATIIDHGTSKLKVADSPEFEAQYVCSDFMPGGNLAARIAERKFLRPEEVEAWLIPIANALQHAHGKNVVHGGLKATSVVFDDESTPYLTDFAVAMHSNSGENSVLLGAPEFMAPEQWDGSTPTTFTDQYSLAVLVFYSLSGVRPYDGHLDPDVRQQNFERGPLPIHEVARRNGNIGILAGLSNVLSRALATKPEDRYPTIGDFCSAFSQSLVPVEVLIKPNIFISYRREVAGGWPTHFAQALERDGMTVFLDVNRRDNVVRFPVWLEKAISKCDIFVCFLSKTTLKSSWVCEEIRIAHRYNKTAIPIFYENFKPPPSLTGLDGSIEFLLGHQAVHLLDRQNLYVDATVAELTDMIRRSVRS